MNQWVQKKDDKWYWYQEYSKEEIALLQKYHIAISRMTKLNFDKIIERMMK